MEKRTNGAKRTNGMEKRTNGAEKRTDDAEKRTDGAEKVYFGATVLQIINVCTVLHCKNVD